ncbi:hypothetical protein [Novosphingobium rosa]|uniref:hypothetical protein n=1 Tax=Novosphingobium rosa TaxID=76978 RepID=UPI00082D3DEA|nr:hypothetical protein [Novosphingobium rosa]
MYTSVKLPDTTLAERKQAAQAVIERYRARIAWAADALIPEDKALDMPSATQAGLLDHWLPEALTARDDMLPPFVKALEGLPEEAPADALGALQALPGGGFDVVARTVAGAYFWSPEINRKLKYPGQQEIRETPDYDVVMDAIAPQLERGDRFIPTP